MKSLLAGICIFISVATFLKKEEAQILDRIETTYTFESVQNYEVLPIQNGNIAEHLFQKVSNTSDEASAMILVKTNDLASNGTGYFMVPLEKNRNIQELIDQYNQKGHNQIEKAEQVINESPLALME